MSEPGHIPVLEDHVLAALRPRPGEVYADATAGLGGHAARIARLLAPGGAVVLNDVDPENLRAACARVESAAPGVRVEGVVGNFASLPRAMERLGSRANLVLADLGFSSNQVEASGRGLSFLRDGPLDMRLDPTLRITAWDLVNQSSEEELAQILESFGEEPGARRIARKLVLARSGAPISTTLGLAAIVQGAVGPRHGSGIHPATRTFQALRMAVNDELGALEALLRGVSDGAEGRTEWLAKGARVAIITFHSLEDRAVKRCFGDLWREGRLACKPGEIVKVSEGEVRRNPRARSAKLRWIELPGPSPAR